MPAVTYNLTYSIFSSTLAGKMTERVIPDSAPAPEAPRDNFSIRNFYTPDSLFTILKQDYKPHSIFLQSNGKKIFEDDYEPVKDVFISVHSELKAKYKGYEGVDRNVKCFWFRSAIHVKPIVYTEWQEDPTVLRGKLAEFGINVDSFHAKEGESRFPSFNDESCYRTFGPKQKPLWVADYLVSGSETTDGFAIHVGKYDFEHWYTESVLGGGKFGGGSAHRGYSWRGTVEIITPWADVDLDTPENFARIQTNHISLTEKVIRAIYKVRNKQLPPAVLQFEPEKEKSSEFMAECGYCNSNYFAAKDPTCPHCGASKPHFIIKEDE